MKHLFFIFFMAVLSFSNLAEASFNRVYRVRGQVQNIQTHMNDGISADIRDANGDVTTLHICPYLQPVVVDMTAYIFERLQRAEANSSNGCKAKTVKVDYTERYEFALGRNKLCIVQVNY